MTPVARVPGVAQAPGRGPVFAFYALMVAVAIAAFFWIRSAGELVTAPSSPLTIGAPPAVVAAPASVDTLFHVLLALSVIIVCARAVGRLFGFIYQPRVVGEVIGGIMLGPSLLGLLAPGAFAQLLPPSIAPFLGLHAQLGIILYMFTVGLDLDTRIFRKNGHATITIAHASMVAPFLLGSGLALFMYPLVSTRAVPFTVFALFIGVSMSITAFPVLARILTDLKISRTRLGTMALMCAAVNDVTAWCLLALVAGVARARPAEAIRTVAMTAVLIGVMLAVVSPLARRVLPSVERQPSLSRKSMAAILVAMLASATAAEAIGIHGIFGAFIFGAIIPSTSRVASQLRHRIEDLVAVLFLPAFFAFTGMRTEIGLIAGWNDWLLCGGIVLVACIGKFGGTAVAARLTGLCWRDSSALGVLMNTRGLVEIIVLNIGLDLHIISARLFTMLVIMAIVTTVMTTPILHLIARRHPWVETERVTA